MPIQQMFLGYGGTTGPDIGTIQFGFDNSDNTFDTSSTSVTYNSSGLTYNTWSGSQLMSGLGGIGANSVQVWKTSNLSETSKTTVRCCALDRTGPDTKNCLALEIG